jgi:putative transposase
MAAISNFYTRCKRGVGKKGFPKFKKHCRSVEYKVSGWKLSSDCKSITFTDGFNIGTLSIFCNNETQEDLHKLKINRVRVVHRADGYYAQFCFDADRKEEGKYTGNVVGLDLGLKFFTKDQNDNAVIYPRFLRKSEKRQECLNWPSLLLSLQEFEEFDSNRCGKNNFIDNQN